MFKSAFGHVIFLIWQYWHLLTTYNNCPTMEAVDTRAEGLDLHLSLFGIKAPIISINPSPFQCPIFLSVFQALKKFPGPGSESSSISVMECSTRPGAAIGVGE